MYNVFQLATNDQSIIYLGQIFGNVGIALSGTGPALLSAMFKTFNTALLVIGALIVAYTTVVGVLATATEGKFLGEKWNSLWVPLRTLIGLVALFPTASGYCAAQVVIMWIVVQGIGAADQIWNTVLDYYKKGGGASANVESLEDIGNLIPDKLKNILGNAICQAALAKLVSNNPSTVARSTPYNSRTGEQAGLLFGIQSNPGECGVVTWVGNVYDPRSGAKPIPQDMKAGVQQAVQALVPVFENLANYYVNQAINNKNCWNADCTGSPPFGNCKYFGKYLDIDFTNPQCPLRADFQDQNGGTMSDNISSYIGSNFITESVKLVSGYANNYMLGSQKKRPVTEDPTTKASVQGWIFAGAYYFNFAARGNKNSGDYQGFLNAIYALDITQDPKVSDIGGSRFAAEDSQIAKFPHLAGYGYKPNETDLRNAQALPVQFFYCGEAQSQNRSMPCKNNGGATSLFAAAQGQFNTANATTGGMFAFSGGAGPGSEVAPVAGSIMKTWMNNLQGQEKDPLVAVGKFGQQLLIAAEALFWIMFVLMVYAFGAGATNVQVLGTTANYAAGVFFALQQFLSMPLWFLMGYMISIGGLLGVYTPLIPYINFSFGAIGWMMAVIEAMVAGPIIALGILSPGGQSEIMGRSQGAIDILLNIFLRPTLMIFGMMLGMLLSYVVISFINAAFLGVVGDIATTVSGGGGNMGLIEILMFIMAYAFFIITALNKCFSLIGLIPDKILRWIGGPTEDYGGAREAEEIKGGVAAGGQAGIAGGKGIAASPKAVKGLAKALKGVKEKGFIGLGT